VSLFSQIIPPTKWVVSQLLFDQNFAEDVTLRIRTGQAFDPTDGFVVDQYTDYPLRAVRMRHTQESVGVSSSDVEIGDTLFFFGIDGFPVECSTKDVIIDSDGVEFGIKGIDHIFAVAVAITVVGAQ
jgi:hypothetical protein